MREMLIAATAALLGERDHDEEPRCANCGSSLKKRTGWVGGFATEDPYIVETEAELLGNTAMASEGSSRGTALTGSLRYATRLPEGSRFNCDLLGPRDLGRAFVERIDLKPGMSIRVGSDTTTRGELEIFNVEEIEPDAVAFEEASPITLLAVSRTILVDGFLRPTNHLDAGLETTHLPKEFEVVSGWNAAQGLPKDDDVAIAAGSVWHGVVRNPSRLSTVLQTSVGLRRTEGFGVLAPFTPSQVTRIAKAVVPAGEGS